MAEGLNGGARAGARGKVGAMASVTDAVRDLVAALMGISTFEPPPMPGPQAPGRFARMFPWRLPRH